VTELETTSTDHAWQNARQVVLVRDKYQCIECGVSQSLHVHHLIPRHLGGADEPANLITLCAACHAARHPTLQVSLSRRFIERWALRLARLFDVNGELPENTEQLSLALKIMGKDRFLNGQLDVVLAALRGESMLVVRPTGSGKTLCFQLPALLRPGTAFVLSPLKALMTNQIVDLQRLKIPATFINGDLTQSEKDARYELLEQNSLKLLYLTPERFDTTVIRDRDEVERLKRIRPSFLVIDEAHCVDRWGEDFRPSYGRIHELRAELGNPPTLAFTATAGLKAQQRILAAIGTPDARVFVSDVDRPNIALIRHEVRSMKERCRITKNLIESTNGKVMIFVPTKKFGEEVSQALAEIGLSVPFYHGKLSSNDREFLLGCFTGRLKPEINTVICTNAFGMGIDIPNVRVVIHWVQPESVEDYLQEFGRAGRDGKPAITLIFKWDGDTGLRQYMAEKTAELAAKKGMDGSASYQRKLENIAELDQMIRNRRMCFRKQIMDYFQAGTSRQRSVAIRILEWLLGRRIRVERATFCCDACDANAARQRLGA
jgi:ATP-dependent DNA helicase RecQ